MQARVPLASTSRMSLTNFLSVRIEKLRKGKGCN